MLLDANGLIYRAYFALFNTPLTTSRGELVNAVFGFWSIVLRGFPDVRPDYVMACFALAAPTFRHEAFAEYKATRQKMPDDLRDQFPKVRELIEAFRIPIPHRDAGRGGLGPLGASRGPRAAARLSAQAIRLRLKRASRPRTC